MRQERIKELQMELYRNEKESKIKALVADHIAKYGGDVVKDDKEAEDYFKTAGIDGEVKHNQIINQTIDVIDNLDGHGDVWYSVRVVVTEHYIDSGSDDYCYSYSIE